MVPAGYTGGGVWGSNPVVDVSRNSVFVSTGNNYTHPTDPTYLACIGGGGRARKLTFGAMALPAKVSFRRPPRKPGPGQLLTFTVTGWATAPD